MQRNKLVTRRAKTHCEDGNDPCDTSLAMPAKRGRVTRSTKTEYAFTWRIIQENRS